MEHTLHTHLADSRQGQEQYPSAFWSGGGPGGKPCEIMPYVGSSEAVFRRIISVMTPEVLHIPQLLGGGTIPIRRKFPKSRV